MISFRPKFTSFDVEYPSSAALHEIVESALTRHSWLLTFPASLEVRFEADTKVARLRNMRVLGTAGALIYSTFIFADLQLPDGLRERVITLRLLEGFLILFSTQFVSRLQLKTWVRECSSVAILETVIFNLLYMLFLDPNIIDKTIQISGLLTVLMYGTIIFPILFRYLVPNAIFLGLIVGVGIFTSPLTSHAKISFYMVFAAMLGMALITAYQQELQIRTDYLQNLSETMRYESLKLDSDRLRLWAMRDGMTGAFNRGYFEEHFPREVQRAAREKTPLSLLMIDIDHFKTYNDTYGHVAGDRCLVEVVNTIKQQLKRPADFIARFGGEEFAVVLPDTDSFGASILANLIQAEIRNLERSDKDALKRFVTLSIGVATFIPDADKTDWECLLKRADEALYGAKNAGRNKIYVDAETEKYFGNRSKENNFKSSNDF